MGSQHSTPSLRRHKPSRQGIVTLNGRDHYLGSWPDGVRKPPAAVQAAYDTLIVQWLAAGRYHPDEANRPATVSDLMLQFWERHAQQHYRHPDGTPTSEIENYKLSLQPLRKLFGSQPAADFSPLKFKAVRQQLIEDGISRGVINQRMGRIRRLVKWGVAEGHQVARGTGFTGDLVRQLLVRFGQTGIPPGVRDVSDLPGENEWWLGTLAKHLGLKPIIVRRWRWSGWLHARQLRAENADGSSGPTRRNSIDSEACGRSRLHLAVGAHRRRN